MGNDDRLTPLILRHPRLKQILDVCQSATEYLTADELSAKRVARYILMLEGAGYIFDTRKRRFGDRVAVNEYRLVAAGG